MNLIAMMLLTLAAVFAPLNLLAKEAADSIASTNTVQTSAPVESPKTVMSSIPSGLTHAPNGSIEPSGLQENRFVQRKILLAFMGGLVVVAIVYWRKKLRR